MVLFGAFRSVVYPSVGSSHWMASCKSFRVVRRGKGYSWIEWVLIQQMGALALGTCTMNQCAHKGRLRNKVALMDSKGRS